MPSVRARRRSVGPPGTTLNVPAATVLAALALSFLSSPPAALPAHSEQQPVPAAELAAEPGSELRVWLLTVDPGEAVWERFGHNAIRVLDTRTGRDVAYNWGIFDFNQADFIPRFLKGQMLYQMAPFSTGAMVASYARANRKVVLQELALTPAQRLALQGYAEWNALPQNRDYFYDYFRDNCSTRVRDLLDRVLDGALADRFSDEPTETSYRYHIRRLTRSSPFLFTGMDVLLGAPGDRPISVWEEMFLPMTLRDAARELTVTDEGGEQRPLVMSEEVVSPAGQAVEAAAPPSWLLSYLLLGLIIGGVLAWAGILASGGSRVPVYVVGAIGIAWSLLVGVVGTILVLALFTDHVFMASNQNLLLVNPLSLALLVLVPISLRHERLRGAASNIALAIVGAAALGLLWHLGPAAQQQNGIFLALTLPIHLGLWYALFRVRPAPVAEAPTPSRSRD